MLTTLGGFAEFERELIRARTGEGREKVSLALGTTIPTTRTHWLEFAHYRKRMRSVLNLIQSSSAKADQRGL
jgi:hypothetical protein